MHGSLLSIQGSGQPELETVLRIGEGSAGEVFDGAQSGSERVAVDVELAGCCLQILTFVEEGSYGVDEACGAGAALCVVALQWRERGCNESLRRWLVEGAPEQHARAQVVRVPVGVAASRTIAATLVDLLTDSAALDAAWDEFRQRTGGGVGGSNWLAPLCDYEPPIDFRWPEYVTTQRGDDWWIPDNPRDH